MVFLKSFLLSLCFLFISFSTFSLDCEEGFSADSVFVDFAKKHLGESWAETMGSKWEKRITYFTKKWNREDAEDFLVFLQNRTGTEDTIKRIKLPSYFHTINYKQFRNRVSLYEEYIGEAGVTLRLRRSLGGFDRGEISGIRAVIKYGRLYRT